MGGLSGKGVGKGSGKVKGNGKGKDLARSKDEHRQDLCMEEIFNIPFMRCRSKGHLAEMRRRIQTKCMWVGCQARELVAGSRRTADSGRELHSQATPGSLCSIKFDKDRRELYGRGRGTPGS